MRTHRYLSCFVAPAMLFFAISGAWQAFRLHEDTKDGSYTAPKVLERLSVVHKAERLPMAARVWFRAGQAILAAAFVATAVLGLVMAVRIARPAWPVWLVLAAGILLPLLLALTVGPKSEADARARPGPAAPPH
jgi:hypothetical protein